MSSKHANYTSELGYEYKKEEVTKRCKILREHVSFLDIFFLHFFQGTIFQTGCFFSKTISSFANSKSPTPINFITMFGHHQRH